MNSPQIILGAEYDACLDRADNHEPVIQCGGEDGLVILYTSGTTGRPKGAVISHRALIARGAVFGMDLGIMPHETFVAWAPFFHMASTDQALATLVSLVFKTFSKSNFFLFFNFLLLFNEAAFFPP